MLKFKSNKGFTMVELLIVLAIIAILAAVAIPIYSSQLENSRIKVDESNLRAATGLAAQDYIVRYADGKDTLKDAKGDADKRYRVYALVDNADDKSANKISSQNMVVLIAGHSFDEHGNVTQGVSFNNTVLNVPIDQSGTNGKVTGTNPNNTREKRSKIQNIPGKKFQGKDLVYFPIQQNGGDAWFDIVISSNGVVKSSQIRK